MEQTTERDWQELTAREKRVRLFCKQKATLDAFLERGAISRAQYDKSYNDMKAKMQITDGDQPETGRDR